MIVEEKVVTYPELAPETAFKFDPRHGLVGGGVCYKTQDGGFTVFNGWAKGQHFTDQTARATWKVWPVLVIKNAKLIVEKVY